MRRYEKGAPSGYVHVIGSFVIAVSLTAAVLAFERRDISAPRYVFVDGGAHEGETVEHFKRTSLYKKHTWEIFAFEANPNLIPDLPKAPDVTVLNQAIWKQDGTIEFFFGGNSFSGSVVKDRITGNSSQVPTVVESVDFGRWLKETVSREDYVLVKLDIEGAEYDVLEKMLSDGTASYMDQLFVEFHDGKLGQNEERERKILSALRKAGVAVDASGSSRPGDWFGVKVGDFRRYGVVFFCSLLVALLIFRLLVTRKRAYDAYQQN